MDFDEVLHMLGDCGLYQRVMYFTICLVGIPVAFNNMGIVILAGVPEHWCAPDPTLANMSLPEDLLKNLTIPVDSEGNFESCSMYAQNYSGWTEEELRMEALASRGNLTTMKCQYGWHYDKSLYEATIVTKWDLVCDDKWWVATVASIFMAGLMVGVVIFGTASDLLGRRPVFIISFILMTTFNICQAFAPSLIAFAIIRFGVGFFNIALFTTAFVLALEIVGQPWRVHAGISLEYYWAVGYMLFAAIAYVVRDWYTLHLVTACPCAVLGLIFIILPESPRWLYTNKKKEKADVVVRKMGRWNKVQLPDKLEVTVHNEKKGFIWDLVRTPRLRYRSFFLFFNWFVNSLVYYGLSLNTSNLGGDPYINFFISGAVEVPAYMFCQVSLTFLGRRWPLSGTMVLAGVALLCTLAVPEELLWISIALAMFGKLCISASFSIIYVFSGELYPTIIRNVGVGTGSFFARVGGVVAPYVGGLSDYGKAIPLIVFGSLSLLAGVLVFLLPETKGEHLPETIDDGENFGRDQNLCGFMKRRNKYDISSERDNAASQYFKKAELPAVNGGSVNPAYDPSDIS